MSPEKELERFIGKYSPEVGAVARAALAKMRTRLPGAVELVYDNYNALAIAFGPSERVSDVIFSIALYPRWVSLFFRTARPFRILRSCSKAAARRSATSCSTAPPRWIVRPCES